jgi:hypothetical protein
LSPSRSISERIQVEGSSEESIQSLGCGPHLINLNPELFKHSYFVEVIARVIIDPENLRPLQESSNDPGTANGWIVADEFLGELGDLYVTSNAFVT